MWIDKEITKLYDQQLAVRMFFPDQPLIVLGRGNDCQKEIDQTRAEADGIAILRRAGGGGAVLLHPGCLVISVGAWVNDYFNNACFFSKINQAVIDFLAPVIPGYQLIEKGISDLAVGDRKVAGTSLFRSRNYLLYQASILYDVKIAMIERYLRHPSKEPDYRKKRTHRDFLVGLQQLNPQLLASDFAGHRLAELTEKVRCHLSSDLMTPPAEQWLHLVKKFGLDGQ